MKSLFACLMSLALVLDASGHRSTAFGADLSKDLASAPCSVPPTIDGTIGADEWKAAPVVEFEMPVLHMKSQKFAKRTCQWRAMNSANGLYVALRVPDPTVNKSLNPLDFDLATLAFCRGSELVAGDDRKVAAPGLYIDKHFMSVGKDADDKQVDGKGAMLHDKAAGVYTIEWAIPLNSGDKEDIQAKPGDGLKFNLAYIDSFTVDLKDTHIGSAYTGGLDKSKDWGTLKLAADVKDDGGATFRGPEWVRKFLHSFPAAPANRLRVVDTSLLPTANGPVAKVLVEYDYLDPRGKKTTGKGKLYLPTNGESVQDKVPLYYSAGYEADDGGALGLAARGFAVATPRAPEVNPLVRTANPDIALLHIARALPFVDDSRVIVAGGSAGGYITLMLAAETFPLSGASPAVPPVNWGYNAAYFLQREQGDSRKDAKAPKTPVFDVIVPIVQAGTKVYGANTSDETYFRHSPVAHLNTVTCPVSVYWTTADMLVPIDQVGKDWVRPFDATKFPPAFTFDPEKLTSSPQGRTRVTDVLKPEDYELTIIPEETIKKLLGKPPTEFTVSTSKQWSITILDEGAPEPQVGHNKYTVAWSQQTFITQMTEGKIAVSQLTPQKLERLLDRYAGREWLPTELKHLDEADSEKYDVVRGLKTYVTAGPEHAKRFAELYAKVPSDKQVLPKDVLEALQAGAAQ